MLLNFRFLIIAFITFLMASCSTGPQYVSNNDINAISTKFSTPAVSKYLIGAEDTVSINVWKNPELSVTVPVRPDGMISMPLIGDVMAAGLTPNEVSKNIQKKLQSFVRNPNVTLMITDLQSHEYLTRVRVTGAVNSQSSLKFRQGMTILDAVLAAGSVNDFAAPNGTKLYRKISNKIIYVDINLGDILYKGQLENNLVLMPGDIITVPERLF